MKLLVTSIFILSSSLAYAEATCTKYRPGRARSTALAFTILPGKQHAHLTIEECDMTSALAPCEYVTDAVYEMEFRPTRLQIWDLKKVNGEEPETLAWEEKSSWWPPHPSANCQDSVCGSWVKHGILTNNGHQICKTGDL